jgi:ABC-type transport system substrate-binding protein
MNMQSSYPIFTSGQVLSANHLNDLVKYLEEQDRLSRNKLIGIGIVCGLEVGFSPAEELVQVRISRGCAVTSAGFLAMLEETSLTKFREYTLPVPQLEEAPEDLLEEPYPFFHTAGGDQVPLWELLPQDYLPAPGEPEPGLITPAFVQDNVALIFLERNPQSLRNCDISDCSDLGIEVEFTLRTLLVGKNDAQVMLDLEEEIANRPVDRHNHPRYDLAELQIEKINPAAHEIADYAGLLNRVMEVAGSLAAPLTGALKESSAAFKYLLGDMFLDTTFPNGPFGDPGFFTRTFDQLSKNIFLGQYFYAHMVDLVEAYNEFLRAAMELDAECCPAEERFPRHILLGLVAEHPRVFDGDSSAPGFNPLHANTGFAPHTQPDAFRHHFIPSPIHSQHGAHPGLEQVRWLYYRLYLLTFRYSLDSLLERPMRITPSKDGDVQLSERAIPFYYALLPSGQKAQDDLARTWSYAKTTRNWLEQIYSHIYSDPASHPLLRRMDAHNFYRIEGAVGKGLGQVMRELLAQKRQLGLSFAIEPVYLGVGIGDDPASLFRDPKALAQVRPGLMTLLKCRVRDLDLIFLMLMGVLFQTLSRTIRQLSLANTSRLAGAAEINRGRPSETIAAALRQPLDRERRIADQLLREIRAERYTKGTVSAKLTSFWEPDESIGGLYQQVRTGTSTSNLFDRTSNYARELQGRINIDADVIVRRIYPAVSLLDKAEELVVTISTPTLAEFDIHQFEQRYAGFVQAYEAYLARPRLEEGDSTDEIDQALRDNYNVIAAATPQVIIRSIMSEFQERANNFLREMVLVGHAQRHTGLEHKGGVPEGGTLVLLYTHRTFIRGLIEQNPNLFAERLAETRNRFGETGEAINVRDMERILAAPPVQGDPLGEYVVLGDLCLPYLCCDTDCSDIDLPIVEEPPPPPPVTEERGTLVVGMAAGFDTLDPGMTTFSNTANIGMHLGDPLVWRAENGEIVPHLAEEWEVDDRGLNWTFKLRSDVSFHDGNPLTAEAVKFTFDRIAERANGSQLAISHLGPYKGSQVVDDFTLKVTFSQPYSAFLNHLCGTTLVPVSPEAVQRAGNQWGRFQFVGSGPFKLESVKPASEVVLVRNEAYQWGQSTLRHTDPPHLERLVYRFVEDDDQRSDMLKAGDILFEDQVPPEHFQQLASAGMGVEKFMLTGSGWGLVFNHLNPPTDDRRVRQAVQLAMDSDQIVEKIFAGHGTTACGPLTKVTPCFDKALCKTNLFDLKKAMALLDEAGWGDRDGDGVRERERQTLTLEYYFPKTNGLAAQIANFTRQALKTIGIEVKLHGLTVDNYLKAERTGKHHLLAWRETGIDPDLVRVLFHRLNANGGTNRGNYQDAEMDKLIAMGVQTFDMAQRCKVYVAIQQEVKEEAVTTFLCDPMMLYAHVDALSGVTYYHDGNIPYFYTARLKG